MLAAKAEVQEWLESAMKDSEVGTREEADALLQYFAQRSGLLLPRGEGLFAFMHLSLQEYFSACFLEPRLTSSRFTSSRLRADPSDAKLRVWAGGEAWCETFVFLFGLVSDRRPTESEGLLQHLFGNRLSSDEKGREAGAALLLAKLASDPSVSMAASRRMQMLQDCRRWSFRTNQSSVPKGGYSASKVIRTLVNGSGGDLRRAWHSASISEDELSGVEALDLTGCSSLSDLEVLASFTRIRSLLLAHCELIADLSPLAHLQTLEVLDLEGCSGISDLSPLASLTRIKTLSLAQCDRIFDVKPLAQLKDLDRLILEGCTGIAEVGALAATSLRCLVIGSVDSMNGIKAISSLHEVHLHYDADGSVDLSELALLPELRKLCHGGLDAFRVSADLQANPEKIKSTAVVDLLESADRGRTRATELGAKPKGRPTRRKRNSHVR